MRANRFYISLCISVLLSALPLFVAHAQERVIITARDTTVFDIQPDEEEFKILSEFYKQMGGKKWKNNTHWLKGKTSADMAKWYGVVVRDGDVSEINLDNNNLNGKVPKSLYKLDRLISVSLENNILEEEAPVNQPKSKSSIASASENMSMSAAGVSEVATASPITTGKNLPVWGLAVQGPNVQQVDWRLTPPVISNLPNSGASQIGASGVAIDDCGKLAFYVLHSGTDQPNQLHIYAANGTRLTNTNSGDPKQGLSSANGNIELQVVRVPGKTDEWFIIYSAFQPPCLTTPPGSAYCPAKVVYARVKYNTTDGLVMMADKREVSISNKTFIQGKAVSRTVNGDTTRHYLYLAQREASGSLMNFTRIHRFIIDEIGINFGTESAALISAKYWVAGIPGSSVELSPDEKKLAISNRNVGANIKEEIIIFDLSQFNSSTYVPSIISIPELFVSGTSKTIKQLSTEAQYACFRNLENKLSQIEFSPSGRYLYCTHGGYPDGTGGMPYNTYLLQIDLQSGSGTGAYKDYEVRMQIEKGIGVSTGCTGTPGTSASNNFIQQIQTAYDGKLYFTKSNSSTLFVIPNPDDPMPHSMVPGAVNLAVSPSSANVVMDNGAKVLFLPENIDGYNYLEESTTDKFSLEKIEIGGNKSASLTIVGFTGADSYQVSWGDGSVESLASSTQSHTYVTNGEYKVVLTIMNPDKCVSISSKIVTFVDCAATIGMEIESTQYLCATKFSVPKITDCYATYIWDFGDGGTSLSRSPMHVYNCAGTCTYTVSVRIKYDCPACRSEITLTKPVTVNNLLPVFEDKVLQIPSDQRLKIISTAATTFSETWPLDHNEPSLENINNFTNGSQGVWRNEGAFVYTTPRSVSAPVAINIDGTYTLEYFNWTSADLQAIPKWVKANSMKRYNAYSFELENEDVLGVSSAALYDYSGQLQSAHGVNTRNEEMGFTGFESFNNKPTGNFIFSTQAVPAYSSYKVNAANSYIAIVEATLQDLQDADRADILAGYTSFSQLLFLRRSRYLQDVKILCKQAHPTNPGWSVIVFETTPYEGLWIGQIRIKNRVVPVVQGLMDNTIAHTGKTSLKINAEKLFEQRLIHLEAGKVYHLNAWVSVNDTLSLTPKLASKIGIDVILKNKQGTAISTTMIVPEGKVIEGWQQVKGSFMCPEKDLILTLKFKSGSAAAAWYDDVRLHPENGNMKSYVYDTTDYRLRAILDEDNFASIFYYDKEGNLYLTKKETAEGIKTITENISYQIER